MQRRAWTVVGVDGEFYLVEPANRPGTRGVVKSPRKFAEGAILIKDWERGMECLTIYQKVQ